MPVDKQSQAEDTMGEEEEMSEQEFQFDNSEAKEGD